MKILRASAITLAVASLTVSSLALASTTQSRDVRGFTKVQLRGALDATIREGNAFSVQITADPAEQPRVTARVEGDTLVLDTVDHDHGFRGDVSAAITLPHFEGVAVDGAGNVTVEGVHAQAVSLAIRGA